MMMTGNRHCHCQNLCQDWLRRFAQVFPWLEVLWYNWQKYALLFMHSPCPACKNISGIPESEEECACAAYHDKLSERNLAYACLIGQWTLSACRWKDISSFLEMHAALAESNLFSKWRQMKMQMVDSWVQAWMYYRPYIKGYFQVSASSWLQSVQITDRWILNEISKVCSAANVFL